VLLLGFMLISGCHSRGPSPNLEGAARSVLVVAADLDALSLDPAVAYEPSSVNICMNLYETLIRYEGTDYSHPRPGLAQSWESPDGLTWTFHLRPDARFASGRPVDAQAVHDSLVRAIRMDRDPAWILKENLAPERIEVVDAHTIRMRLLHPSAYFLSTLFNAVAAAVDIQEVARHSDYWLRDHSAGSGPFTLARWEPDVAITMETRGGTPLRRVIIKDIKEPTMQQMMLQRGDVDMAYDIPPLQTASLELDPHVALLPAPLLRVWYVGMNVTQKPLDDVRVRQAIRFAIDYPGILKYLLKGRGISLEGPIVQGMPGFHPDLGVYHYDPQRARQLLKSAGLGNGFDITLTSGGGATELGPSVEDLCAKLQQDLGAVGIRVQVQTISGTAYLDLYRKGKLQLNLGLWSADYPDPHDFIGPFGRSDGSLAMRVHYADPEMDRLIDQGAEELNPQRRDAIYVEAQKRLADSGPWAILVQSEKTLPMRREVHGFVWNPLSTMDFSHVFKAAP
jgi:peptide/nickel transport system substrate-binding protein